VSACHAEAFGVGGLSVCFNRTQLHFSLLSFRCWDEQLEYDFAPGGQHEKMLENVYPKIDAGNFTPLP
jgi:hypothetical protein